MAQSRLFQKFLLEIVILVVGISISFWINSQQTAYENRIKEQQLLENIALSLQETSVHIEQRKAMFEQENKLMDYLSKNWNNVNTDSIVNVLVGGKYFKSFHNLFLDYREFHPPIAEIESLIADGSIALISNPKIKIALIALTDSNLGFVTQNIASEIDLQQAFRAALLNNPSPALLQVLQTSQKELYDRFVLADPNYKQKIAAEISAIVQQPQAQNYLNLKIRQRYFVMFFFELFEQAVKNTQALIAAEGYAAAK